MENHHRESSRVFIEMSHDVLLPGTVTGTSPAKDRPYRVSVKFDNGMELEAMAPECITPQEPVFINL
jgi:hypothetical protein